MSNARIAAGKKLVGKTLNKVNPVEALREITTAYADLARMREEEATKRQQIMADRETCLAAIHAQREVLMAYLDRSFAERAETFRELFRHADEAVERGDSPALMAVGRGIVDTTKNSPFAALADLEQTRNALKSGAADFSL